MSSKINIKKFVICTMISFTMIINSYAAIVSDSDGNNFITKSDFFNMKESFAEQIGKYQDSLSSRIEGSIAEYLSGISVAKTHTVNPFYTIDASTTYEVVSPATGTLSRTLTNYNKISLSFTMGRTDSTVGGNIAPMSTSYSSGWFAMGSSTNASQDGQGSAFITKSGNADVVDAYYSDCYLHLTGGCSCFGLGITGSSYHFYKFEPLTNMKLNVASTNASLNSARGQSGDIPESTYRQDNPTSPSMFSNYKLGSCVFIVSVEKNVKDDTVYLFNNCNETNINTWNEDDVDLLNYDSTNVDNIVNPSFPNERYTNSIKIPTSEFCKRSGSSTPYAGTLQFNKLYVDQKAAKNAGYTSGFTNLNQLRNGYLKYKANGVESYPKFYGGLPLLTVDSDISELKFTIKMVPTTSSYTGKMKLWIKENEFVNSNDYTSTAWNTVDAYGKKEKDYLMDISVEGETKNSDGSVNVPSNTETVVTIKNVKKKGVYFLRFCEADKNYGGKLTVLNNFNYVDES